MQVFETILRYYNSSKYLTTNLYLQNVWKIQLHLNEEVENEDEATSNMTKQMKPQFKNY